MNTQDLIVQIAVLSSMLIVILTLVSKSTPAMIQTMRQTLRAELQAATGNPTPTPTPAPTPTPLVQINGLVPPPPAL